MSKLDRSNLLDTLRELSLLYPMMRFGQLAEFASRFGLRDGNGSMSEAEDAAIIDGCRAHMAKRRDDLGKDNGGMAELTLTREELLRVLEEIWDLRPDIRFGQLVVQLAESANLGIYDIEDDRLLDEARKARNDDVFAEVTGGGLGHWKLEIWRGTLDRLLDAVFTCRNELIAEIAEGVIAANNPDACADQRLNLAFQEVACSQTTVGAIAPLLETLAKTVTKRFRKYHEEGRLDGDPQHHRWQWDQDHFWNPSLLRDKKNPTKTDNVSFVGGFRQLLKALRMETKLREITWKRVEALFDYRNAALHEGYEWPEKRREEFARTIKERQWDEWFDICTVDGIPWLISLSDGFIHSMCFELEEMATAFRIVDQELGRKPPALADVS